MDALRLEVKVTLPSVTNECLEKLLERMEALGVENKEDLKFLKEDDIIDVLKPIQCRKLLGKYSTTDPQPNGGQNAVNQVGVEQVTMRSPSSNFQRPPAWRCDSGVSTDSCPSALSSQRDAHGNCFQPDLVQPRDTNSLSSWSQDDDDERWSDYDEFYSKEFQEDEVESENQPVYLNLVEWSLLERQGNHPHILIAKELLTSERAYVGVLHTIHHVFYTELDKENTQSSFLKDNMLAWIFSNTESIYKLHHEFLLPQLEERIKEWNSNPRIGDIMKSYAPFLKIYTEYMNNMRRAMTQIDKLMKKSKRFNQIINRLEKLPECKNLALQHHMLEPLQRLTRYELLMKVYIRVLPPDSPDMQDSQEALVLISKASLHTNEALKKNGNLQKVA